VLSVEGFLTVASSLIDHTAFTHERDESLPGLLHVAAWRRDTSPWNYVAAGTTFVYAVHGRSVRTCAWSLDLLLDSNEQLVEVRPSIVDDVQREYCLPSGGITAGLCGSILLLSDPSTR